MKSNIEEKESIIDDLNEKIKNLENDYNILKKSNGEKDSLNENIEEKDNEIKKLNENNQKIKSELRLEKEKNKKQELKLEDKENKIQKLSKKNETLKTQNDESSKKIKQFQENNISKYNYFTGETLLGNKRKINDMNYPEIIENKKKKLDKDSVLIMLLENKNSIKYKCKSYSIKEIKKEIIKKDENNEDTISVRNKILNVINLYNQNNIKNEWEKNRKEWYQNNQRFNPIFKINEKTSERNCNQMVESTTVYSRRAGDDNNGPNNGGGGGGAGGV
jgi:hypothetical protein